MKHAGQHVFDTAVVLARNDVWLSSVVESFGLCPFAHPCRTSGQLRREVLTGLATDVALARQLLRLQLEPDGAFEVGLLLVPRATADPRRFERQVRRVAAAVDAQLAAQHREPTCHVVAFHPQMPFTPDTPAGLTGLWRRSPDPTLQLVSKSVLTGLRERVMPLRYVDVAEVGDLTQWLAAHKDTARLGLSERIALANARVWENERPALLAALAAAGGGVA